MQHLRHRASESARKRSVRRFKRGKLRIRASLRRCHQTPFCRASGTVGNRKPKTPAGAARLILRSRLQRLLRVYAEGRRVIYSQPGGVVLLRSATIIVLRGAKSSEHMRHCVPQNPIGLWLGHAPRSVTDLYANGLQHDLAWRREWCDRVGRGFSIGLSRAINTPSLEPKQAA